MNLGTPYEETKVNMLSMKDTESKQINPYLTNHAHRPT